MRYNLLSRISLFKQKKICTVNLFVYILEQKSKLPPLFPKIPIRYIRITNPDKLLEFSTDQKIKNEIFKFNYLLNNGAEVYLALASNDIAGFYWVTNLSKFKVYLFNNHSIFAGNDNYFIFYCRTFPKYRNKRIFSYILTEICQNILNYQARIFITTSPNNYASQKGIEKAGFKNIGLLKYFEIFGIRKKKFLTIEYKY